jgi:hypothetical protein
MYTNQTAPGLPPLPALQFGGPDFTGHPILARIFDRSVVLMGALGPIFWTALIVLFARAELFAG